ncbi:hypothetical protein HHK36_019393 [Tetracentron sinense]|uniref:Uncharacterized protein n=1 Tax=Tetracentron sinense TaxID=13715 RepID=A0A835DC85_TETSI|nr:hypothetical protein HHK36_019393 [Tetracentron sinense]
MEAPSSLRRRNSIPSSVLPTKLHLPAKPKSSSFPYTNGDKPSLSTVDFELLSLRSLSYTSLKDLIPSSPGPGIQSPTGPASQSGYEISIRNRLVKQAAWAYLQPMSASSSSSGGHFFRRMWVKFSGEYIMNPINACLEFINLHVIPAIIRAFDMLLGAIWIGRNKKRNCCGLSDIRAALSVLSIWVYRALQWFLNCRL